MDSTSEQNDHAKLDELRKTLVDSSELMAAFISLGRSSELPVECVMKAADEIYPRLCKWRQIIESYSEIFERDEVH